MDQILLNIYKNNFIIKSDISNYLTVIANESYDDFAKALQNEIADDCNVSFKDRVKNKNKRQLKAEFNNAAKDEPITPCVKPNIAHFTDI